jgi:hypothetical protein
MKKHLIIITALLSSILATNGFALTHLTERVVIEKTKIKQPITPIGIGNPTLIKTTREKAYLINGTHHKQELRWPNKYNRKAIIHNR